MRKKVVNLQKKLIFDKSVVLNLQAQNGVNGGGDSFQPVSALTKEGPCGTCVGPSVGECGPGTASMCQGNCSVRCVTQNGAAGC